jgi:DNA polymerase III sliding clamp (beta) subunit (PCNA family)
METVSESKILTDSVTVQGITLLELLEGASTHADKGKSALTALNSVQLIGEGEGTLSARATDRFRLIEGTIEGEGTLSPSLIALDDVKRIVDLVKANKAARVSLNRIGDLLTVSAGGSSLTLNLMSANYPGTFDDLLNKSERECFGEVAFNPAYFADYAKIAGKGNAVRVEFTGERKPIIVHLPATKVTWRALLMPMRVI